MNRDGGGEGIDGTAARPIHNTVFGPLMKCAAGCGKPVDQNEPHVRVGVAHQFKEGKMIQADVYHIDCWRDSPPAGCTCVGGSWCAIHGDVPRDDNPQLGLPL